MDLTEFLHIDIGDDAAFHPHLVIGASGYESRSTCIPRYLESVDSEKVAIGFRECRKDLARPQNDRYFQQSGYRQVLCGAHEIPDFSEMIGIPGEGEFRILADISVMTRMWYHGLLKYIHQLNGPESIKVRIAYCPAIYSEPLRTSKQFGLKSVSFLDSDRPSGSQKNSTALIIGLGNEPNVCTRIQARINPDITHLLFADPAMERKCVEDTFINNHDLIQQVSIRNLHGYPLNGTKSMYQILLDLVLPLRENHRVIIVPQGPKIFSVVAMIMQISYPDIHLVYPLYSFKQVRDRKPGNRTVTIDLHFQAE